MTKYKVVIKVFIIFQSLTSFIHLVSAQSLPDIPQTLKFAGVTIHLTDSNQIQLKKEVSTLYANRNQLLRDVTTLRQLTSLLQPRIREAGLPDDFRYIIMPFADINSNAYWCVQQSQAQVLRLQITDEVDERYHPILVTEAVLPYLSRLRETQTNYVATLLRYFQPSIASFASSFIVTQKDPTDIQLSPQIPAIIWKVLARKLAIEHEEPTYRPLTTYLLFEYRSGGGQTLSAICKKLKVDAERMSPYNGWLKNSTVPTDEDYSVLIRVTPDELPTVKLAAEAGQPTLPVFQTDVGFPVLKKVPERESGLRAKAVLYTINDRLGAQAQVCDNPVTLAYYGRITIGQFLKYNELTEQDVLWPGQIYYLEPKAKRAKVPYHVMQRNQTLREVSNMYGVRLSYLLFFNDIAPTQRVQPGRIIWMRKKRPYRRPVEYLQLPPVEQTPGVKPDSVRLDSTIAKTSQLPAVKRDSITSDLTRSVQQQTLSGDTSSVAGRDTVQYSINEPIDQAADIEPRLSPGILLHVVKPGQTYYAISKLYRVTLKQLYSWNNLSEQVPLKIGQELIVDTREKPTSKPVSSKVVSKPKLTRSIIANPPVKSIPKVYYYTVKPGQTVYRVALINQVSIPDLMRWNNLTNYVIAVGQRLVIRKP
jgi:membrane-bound lytic murein transglycosylase D